MPLKTDIPLGRRTITAALGAAAMLAAGFFAAWPAQAGTEKVYEGRVRGPAPGTVEFVVERADGEMKITDFRVRDVTSTCRDGDTFTEQFGFGKIAIRKRNFTATKNTEFRGSHIVSVKGRLSRGGRASGTLRAYTGLDEMPFCDTGTLEWKAKD